METIPFGACNATITQMQVTKNVLALRWMSSDSWTSSQSSYFLNGNWIFQTTGNYSAKGDAYTYIRPIKPEKDAKEREKVTFTTQLTRAIETCLVTLSKNHGVVIKYFLPPVHNIAQGKPENANVKAEGEAFVSKAKAKEHLRRGTKNKRGREAGVNEAEGEDDDEGEEKEDEDEEEEEEDEGEEEEDDEGEEEDDDDEAEEEDEDDAQGQNGELQSSDGSQPAWINDLRNIMNLWEQQMDGQTKQISGLRKDLKIVDKRLQKAENGMWIHNTLKQ